MVDVNACANRKLVDRGGRIIAAITGLDREKSLELLHAAKGRVKIAIVMHLRNVDAEAAQRLLAEHDGKVRAVMDMTAP